MSIEPEHYQLNFCLGYINYKAKGDLDRAEQDMKIFLHQRSNSQFPKFALAAENILSEISKLRVAKCKVFASEATIVFNPA